MTEILAAPAVTTLHDSATGIAIATRRVLHVINGEHYSGAERVQDLLAQELPACGFDVSFACVKPDRFPEVRKYQAAPLYRVPMQSRFDLHCARQLSQLIQLERFNLVHAHTPRSLLVAAIAARDAGVPLVYHVHSPAGKDSSRWLQNLVNARLEGWLLRRAAKLITVSPSLTKLMINQGFAAERVVYVPNGVPEAPIYSRQRPLQQWTLGMAALFRPRKGIEVLLEAMAGLRGQGFEVRLRAIGPFETSAYQSDVLALAEQLGVADAIQWTGFVSDIHAELQHVDLFVLPSLFGEGLPMVLLEAMAAGLPVVASDVEGVPAALRDRVEGLLVEPNDPAQLASAIRQLIDSGSSHDYRAMCDRARERHARCFSASTMAAGVAQVYRQVLGPSAD